MPAPAAKSFQSCPTLCDPIDGSSPNPLNGVSPGASELLGQRLRVRTGAVMWSQAQTSCSVGWRRAQESYLDRCKEQHMEVS